MTFIYIVLAIMIACICGIVAWVVIKNAESDAKYEAEIDRIYSRKRK
jgi:flagellar basal body-associated protein FliL